MFLLCWAPAPFLCFVWVFLFVALCYWVRVDRYAFVTGGNAFLPNAWICVWFVLFCHHPVYRLFVSSYDFVATTFISHRKDRAFELNRPHSRKKNMGQLSACGTCLKEIYSPQISFPRSFVVVSHAFCVFRIFPSGLSTWQLSVAEVQYHHRRYETPDGSCVHVERRVDFITPVWGWRHSFCAELSSQTASFGVGRSDLASRSVSSPKRALIAFGARRACLRKVLSDDLWRAPRNEYSGRLIFARVLFPTFSRCRFV